MIMHFFTPIFTIISVIKNFMHTHVVGFPTQIDQDEELAKYVKVTPHAA